LWGLFVGSAPSRLASSISKILSVASVSVGVAAGPSDRRACGARKSTVACSPVSGAHLRTSTGAGQNRAVQIRSSLNTREQELEALLAPMVEAHEGLELLGIEYAAQGRHSRLRIYIERLEGRVTIEDCELISREVSDVLDVEDLIPQTYTLEVSSPGMDRILFKPAQYLRNIGQVVDVRLHYPFEGSKRVQGVLAGVENDEVLVQVEAEEYVLPLENIQRARLVPQFD